MPDNADFVHTLLGYLHQRDWRAAPQYLGQDVNGREILTFLPGEVPWSLPFPEYVTQDRNLYLTGQLARQLHDLTRDTTLSGHYDVVCHRDLCPKNTVYQDLGNGLQPVGLIDWDTAQPGNPQDDLAQLCWQTLRLGPTITDLILAAHRIRIIFSGYGAHAPAELILQIINCQQGLINHIETGLPNNQPDAILLHTRGDLDDVRAELHWTQQNEAELSRHLGWGDRR